MPTNNTKTLHGKQKSEASDGPEEAGDPSPLLAQAQAWADVARAAHENCAKGEDAERVLRQRRNASGQ